MSLPPSALLGWCCWWCCFDCRRRGADGWWCKGSAARPLSRSLSVVWGSAAAACCSAGDCGCRCCRHWSARDGLHVVGSTFAAVGIALVTVLVLPGGAAVRVLGGGALTLGNSLPTRVSSVRQVLFFDEPLRVLANNGPFFAFSAWRWYRPPPGALTSRLVRRGGVRHPARLRVGGGLARLSFSRSSVRLRAWMFPGGLRGIRGGPFAAALLTLFASCVLRPHGSSVTALVPQALVFLYRLVGLRDPLALIGLLLLGRCTKRCDTGFGTCRHSCAACPPGG